RDHAHRLVENFTAVTVSGKYIARRAARMNADHNSMRTRQPRRARIAWNVSRSSVTSRATRAEISAHQRDVALSPVDFAFVRDHAKLAIFGLNARLAGANDVALVP